MIVDSNQCYCTCLGKDLIRDLIPFCGEDLKASEPETVLE